MMQRPNIPCIFICFALQLLIIVEPTIFFFFAKIPRILCGKMFRIFLILWKNCDLFGETFYCVYKFQRNQHFQSTFGSLLVYLYNTPISGWIVTELTYFRISAQIEFLIGILLWKFTVSLNYIVHLNNERPLLV